MAGRRGKRRQDNGIPNGMINDFAFKSLRESVDVITFESLRMLLNLVGVVNVALPQVTDGMMSRSKFVD